MVAVTRLMLRVPVNSKVTIVRVFVEAIVASFSGPVCRRARPLMPPGFPARPQANADRLGRARNHVRSRSRRRARECGFRGSDPCECPDLADDDPFLHLPA